MRDVKWYKHFGEHAQWDRSHRHEVNRPFIRRIQEKDGKREEDVEQLRGFDDCLSKRRNIAKYQP